MTAGLQVATPAEIGIPLVTIEDDEIFGHVNALRATREACRNAFDSATIARQGNEVMPSSVVTSPIHLQATIFTDALSEGVTEARRLSFDAVEVTSSEPRSQAVTRTRRGLTLTPLASLQQRPPTARAGSSAVATSPISPGGTG